MLFLLLWLTVAPLLTPINASCGWANWWDSLDAEGLSKCNDGNIRGFYRSKKISNARYDPLYLLDKGLCCSMPHPWNLSSKLVLYADWWNIFDRNYRWAKCPSGYFLNGIWRSDDHYLYNIEEGRCAKPATAPNSYDSCYNHDIRDCFNDEGECKCRSGYFVTGLHRGSCDELHCLEELRCCKPASATETLDDLYKVKKNVMELTLRDMALLAHYMGYGWCGGCRSGVVGEDFVRRENSWHADRTRRCSGVKHSERLELHFGDWNFGTGRIAYGPPVKEELMPETLDRGNFSNDHSTQVTKTISRSAVSTRSVTHTTTSSWKMTHGVGIEIKYSDPLMEIGGSYTFTYENGLTTNNSKNKKQSQTFTVTSEKVLEPFSAARFELLLTKIRSTVSYKAEIIPKFSTEFRGFMRWGGGPRNMRTNYHVDHKGSHDRKTVDYKFGNASTPFYEDLFRQSKYYSDHWLWNEIKSNYPYTDSLIRRLTNKKRFIFHLTGKFEDVIGKGSVIRWSEVPHNRTKRSASGVLSARQRSDDSVPKTLVNVTKAEQNSDVSAPKTLFNVAKAGPDDLPAPNPAPPSFSQPEGIHTSDEAPEIQVLSRDM